MRTSNILIMHQASRIQDESLCTQLFRGFPCQNKRHATPWGGCHRLATSSHCTTSLCLSKRGCPPREECLERLECRTHARRKDERRLPGTLANVYNAGLSPHIEHRHQLLRRLYSHPPMSAFAFSASYKRERERERARERLKVIVRYMKLRIHSLSVFRSLYFISFHFTSLHFVPLHFISFHVTSFHFTSLHFASFHFTHSFIHSFLSFIHSFHAFIHSLFSFAVFTSFFFFLSYLSLSLSVSRSPSVGMHSGTCTKYM